MSTANPSIWLAFLAGLLSFVSPCCLPLYPSYISYISGISFQTDCQFITSDIRRRALFHSLFFVLGFSIIFIALGMSANFVGTLFSQNRILISQIGGVIVVAMGLFMLGFLKIDFLMKEKKWMIPSKPASYLGAILVGISFAAGWTPCIGPILASVLILAASQPVSGMTLMFFYILGFAIPFLILAYSLGSTKWLRKYSGSISKIGGAIMILMGILLYFNRMPLITSWLIKLYGGFTGF
ncbi:cytochrome c biogenesis protein CcdA [Fodinisporobacter ferrooxydans]|uniref:Cytochrome c biogenesis protein CcdA n=2 Tax=Fodinisporobacter ferrooxydans TaxID=2901836 RepID=A0ABY4CWN0_9BACL|nr:cytochrome c biogenesis protein CcdA [Alicyclobacillaceae bacterium MYW30-H2]